MLRFTTSVLLICAIICALCFGSVSSQGQATIVVVGCRDPYITLDSTILLVEPKKDVPVILADGSKERRCKSDLCKDMRVALESAREFLEPTLSPESPYQIRTRVNQVNFTTEAATKKLVAVVGAVLAKHGKLGKGQVFAEGVTQLPKCATPTPTPTPTPEPTPTPTPTPTPVPTLGVEPSHGPFTQELFYDLATDTGSEGSQVVLLLNAMRRLPGGVLVISNGCWKQRFGPNVQAGLLRWQASLAAAHGVQATGRVDAPMRAYLNKLYASRRDLFDYLPWPPCQPAKAPAKKKKPN